MKRTLLPVLPIPVDGELRDMVKDASRKTKLSQSAVLRSALRIGVPEVVKRLEVRRKPQRNLVEYLDAFVGLVQRDSQKIEPLRLR